MFPEMVLPARCLVRGSVRPSTAIKWPQIDFKGFAYKKVGYKKIGYHSISPRLLKKCQQSTARAKQKEKRSRGGII
jgi:hypothetical protein